MHRLRDVVAVQRRRSGGEHAPEGAPDACRAPQPPAARELGSLMAARTSTRVGARRDYLNIAGSQYSNTDLAEVVAALEAVDLAHAPPAALTSLLVACAATEARIAVRLASVEPPAPPSAAPEAFISVKAAAARLGVAPKWLYRRKNKLPFLREIVPETWRVSVPALERWMAARARRSP
jgi:hypothetical protein